MNRERTRMFLTWESFLNETDVLQASKENEFMLHYSVSCDSGWMSLGIYSQPNFCCGARLFSILYNIYLIPFSRLHALLKFHIRLMSCGVLSKYSFNCLCQIIWLLLFMFLYVDSMITFLHQLVGTLCQNRCYKILKVDKSRTMITKKGSHITQTKVAKRDETSLLLRPCVSTSRR